MSAGYVTMLKNIDKLPIYTDIETLDIFCEYLLNDSSKYINFANLNNLQDYINNMDPKMLMSNDAKMARYLFIKSYLEARLDNGVVSRKLCISHVEDTVDNKYKKIIQREIINSVEPDTLKKSDIDFINNMIFTQLNVMFMHKYKIPITKMMEDLNSNSFGKVASDCTDAIQLYQMVLNDLTKAQRRSKQDNRFNLSDPNHFKSIMNEAFNRLLSDNQYQVTGWQGLNRMLGGGFENARVYNFIGATGGFKSGLLLNIMKSIKLYNRGKEHKDPTKRPTILFISQENNIWETVGRIFGIFGTTEKIKKFSVEDIMNILNEGGFKLVEDELDIDIEFRYYGNMDVGVPDLRGIYEELENSGREVVCIIQDYIERLRPPMMTVDKRIQLNDVSNQLHDLAIDLDIPIITASQFNRGGVATIEDMQGRDKHDIAKNIGSKDVSESFGMLKNFDVNIAIVIEYDAADERFYLSFRVLKFRGDDSNTITYFLQPFVGKNSKIQLMDDFNEEKPLYRLGLIDEGRLDIVDDSKEIQMASMKNRDKIEPIDITKSEDISTFMDTLWYDIDHSKSPSQAQDKVPIEYTDNDGFIILLPKVNLIRKKSRAH